MDQAMMPANRDDCQEMRQLKPLLSIVGANHWIPVGCLFVPGGMVYSMWKHAYHETICNYKARLNAGRTSAAAIPDGEGDGGDGGAVREGTFQTLKLHETKWHYPDYQDKRCNGIRLRF
ncbi:hypothetical protein AWENTII_000028 [Aspergillus wentii]